MEVRAARGSGLAHIHYIAILRNKHTERMDRFSVVVRGIQIEGGYQGVKRFIETL